MRWAWKIGRLAGIEVRVHVTFFALLAWIGWASYASDGDLGTALRAVTSIVVLFAIVVLHELGHAMAARRYGIATRHITLLPIGGIAMLDRMPDEPRHELVVALAGPAVNVALALLVASIALATGTPLVPDDPLSPTVSPLAQLLWINVLLAVFNMLPAFPMDGGRALRAVLAMRLGPLRATQVAATLGQGIAMLLGFAGLLGNPVLLFIALFVWVGATAEAKVAQMRNAMDGLPVKCAMVRDFQTLAAGDPLARAVALTLEGFQEDFPVLEGGRVIGVLSRDNLLRALAEGGESRFVATAMEREFRTTHPGAMLDDAFRELQEGEGKTMPVVSRDGALVGLLTVGNIGELVMLRSALDERESSLAA